MSLNNFRDWAWENSPAFLKGDYGSRVVYMFHVLFDAIADGFKTASLHSHAGLGDEASLTKLAEDRGLTRGLFETEEDFAKDVQRAFTNAPFRGGSPDLARKLCRVFYSGSPLRVEVKRVYDSTLSGVSFSVTNPYDDAVKVDGGPTQLDWDGVHANWCRLILIADLQTFPGGAEEHDLSDDTEMGDGSILGTSMTEAQLATALSEVRKARAGHTRFVGLYLDYTGFSEGLGNADLQQTYAVNWQGGNSWSCMIGTPGNYTQVAVGFIGDAGSWFPIELGNT